MQLQQHATQRAPRRNHAPSRAPTRGPLRLSSRRAPRAPLAAPQQQPRAQGPLDPQPSPAAAPAGPASPPRRAPAPPAATAVRAAEAAAAAPPRGADVEFLGVLDGMQTVRGVIEVDAHPDLVYAILTDYDRCSEVRACVQRKPCFCARVPRAPGSVQRSSWQEFPRRAAGAELLVGAARGACAGAPRPALPQPRPQAACILMYIQPPNISPSRSHPPGV